jgi:hypothetical protein
LISERVAVCLAVAAVGFHLAPRSAAAKSLGDEAARVALPSALAASTGDPRIGRFWSEGVAHERREALLESNLRYEAIAEALPDSSFIRWRVSRNYWRHAERLAADDKSGRLHYFGLAESWAARSLDLNPECGECILWRLAAMGRLATTRSVLESMNLAATIAEMIDRGIALHPTHDDGASNVAMANLYYAGAAFYRIVPDWFWVKWLIGVRGDKQRALEYIRKALAMSDPRVDYQVELGAVLLCIGHDAHDAQRLAEGRQALEAAMHMPLFQSTDTLDLDHARILMAEPERACGYSRDGWIDLREAKKR